MADDLTAPTEPLAVPTSTTPEIVGSTVQRTIGTCFGLVVRSVGFAKGFTGSVRALHHGEVKEYTGTLEQARRHALDRMIEHAQSQGANAVVGIRFDSSDVGDGLAGVVAYGTAVVIG
jgi:uncharacterized protein YbjQ (UPF0145 family)